MQIIKDFIQANYSYYKDKLLGDTPEYIKEQVVYRLKTCKDDCVPNNKCNYCGCPPAKKSWSKHSCNNGERFPDLMNKDEWEEFKTINNVEL